MPVVFVHRFIFAGLSLFGSVPSSMPAVRLLRFLRVNFYYIDNVVRLQIQLSATASRTMHCTRLRASSRQRWSRIRPSQHATYRRTFHIWVSMRLLATRLLAGGLTRERRVVGDGVQQGQKQALQGQRFSASVASPILFSARRRVMRRARRVKPKVHVRTAMRPDSWGLPQNISL